MSEVIIYNVNGDRRRLWYKGILNTWLLLSIVLLQLFWNVLPFIVDYATGLGEGIVTYEHPTSKVTP